MARILIVEDEPLVANALRRSFQRDGHDVDVAHGHAEALMFAGPYDCGVFDIGLPDSDGVELAQRLLDRGIVNAALFFTGAADADAARRTQGVGAVIHKSEGLQALRAAMTLVLTHREAAGRSGSFRRQPVSGAVPRRPKRDVKGE